MRIRLYIPTEIASDRGEWGCVFEVDRGGTPYRATARGNSWLEVLHIAISGIRQQVPEAEEDEWRTSDGIPFWLRFPQQVPVGWGYKPYRFMCDQIEDAMSNPKRRDWPTRRV